MNHDVVAVGALIGWLALSACSDGAGGDSGTDVNEGPELSHESPPGTFVEGDPARLTVSAADPDGVASVVVHYRTTGQTYWDSEDLVLSGGLWSTELLDLSAPGIDYYFKAVDRGTSTATSFLPAEASVSPFTLDVLPRSVPLPFVEDFEPAGEGDSLYAMDWWTPSDGFGGYAFELFDPGHDGSFGAAWHGRGVSGIDPLSDWLISPALDLSDQHAVMVTWWELGAGPVEVSHGLWVSTGSRDPDDGDFVPVDTALAPPDGDGRWSRASAVDLSAWAGESVVYLAWHYVGQYADDWTLDDVWVRALGPDLDANLSWSPDPVHPGETTTVSFQVDNRTDAPARALEATLSLPDGGGELSAATVSVDDIPGLGSGTARFSLTVDPSFTDNQYLPVELSLTDGADRWDFTSRLIVGVPSEAVVALTLDDASVVSVVVGMGHPDAPEVSFTAWAGVLDAGSSTLPVDITPAALALPPAAGPTRWFARVSSGATGTVDGFSISFDGRTDVATVLPEIDAGVPTVVWLPEPAKPVLLSIAPNTVEPGDAGVGLTLTLINGGALTSGAVNAEVVAGGSGVVVVDGGPFALTAAPWGPGETVDLAGIVVDIDPDHDDSTPVHLDVVLDDGVEDWIVEVELDVPWPVLKIVGITIADSGGDGVLDPGETAGLDIRVANTGDLHSFDQVFGTLSLADTSTAGATVTSRDGIFGEIVAGGSQSNDAFAILVDTGSAGDSLDLVLELTDGDVTTFATAQIVLGEPPWFVLATSDDDAGDNIDDYDWDYVNGKYRVVDGQVELQLESHVAYDAETLFLEAWGTASGGYYSYYRWVFQSGAAKLQGYRSGAGFSTIGAVEVEYPSTTELLLRWSLEDMSMSGDRLAIGLAAGWCGPDEYYCDHFPDGWGYPYVSYSPSSWFTISW